MKRRLLAIVCLFSISSGFAQPKGPNEKKTKVIILGTFHFASNNDGIKFERENMMTEKRQKEIDEVNNALAKIQPDKIFIEWRPGRQAMVDSTYKAYLKGTFTLTPNEVHQIAFKLAKQLNHKGVYCMDAPGVYLFDTVLKTAEKYKQIGSYGPYFDTWKTKVLLQDSLQKLLTLKDRLKEINSPENIMFSHFGNAGVTYAPQIGTVGEYAGAEFMGEWYKRNMRMYSNVLRQTGRNDTAILIIVGAGHARIIEHLFEDNPDFEVVSVLDYLK